LLVFAVQTFILFLFTAAIIECFSETSYRRLLHRLLRDYDKAVPPSMSIFTSRYCWLSYLCIR